MTDLKTRPDQTDVAAFLDAIEPPRRRAQAKRLDAIFRAATGFEPVIWGGAIVGYGRYLYQYDSGRKGDYLATGFAVRKTGLVLYILPGFSGYGEMLDRLGKYKVGKSCLHLSDPDAIDEGALGDLIRACLADLGRRWTVLPA